MARDHRIALCALPLLFIASLAAPALAHGDKVIPQVPDGTATDGTTFRTKFDLINLGPEVSQPITKVKLLFFNSNGTPWSVATNLGTASEFTLNMGPYQTVRIETLGSSSALRSGYAILRNLERTTTFPDDYEVAISVFYEIGRSNGLIDTVSVVASQPTVWWIFPAETDVTRNLYTGFAIVNLSGVRNAVSLRLRRATSPSTQPASDRGSVTFTLEPGEQKALFLTDRTLFPAETPFRGMLEGGSEFAVAIMGILQSPMGSGGVQYASMAPSHIDALRRNTFMYLRQGFPLDADIPIVDYSGNDQNTDPWDLLYVTQSTTARRLESRNGAQFAVIGKRTDTQFDNDISIETLSQLTYTSNSIDLSDGSPNLDAEVVIAVKTGLGRYVKMRIAAVITRGTDRDLGLEIYIYK